MEAPDCELTRHLQAALGEIKDTWRASPYPPTPEAVARCEFKLEAALGLLAHARITDVDALSAYLGGNVSRVLVVPLAEEPHLYATEDDDGRPLMGDLGA